MGIHFCAHKQLPANRLKVHAANFTIYINIVRKNGSMKRFIATLRSVQKGNYSDNKG